ncbi:MAG: hypothetical protein HYZ75_18965 [Elusimicrobia bacterium]|nr:hypothetical protein [Elusimicrobiota bacterium]
MRLLSPPSQDWAPRTAKELIAQARGYLPAYAREKENRFIIHNVALLSEHPDPASVTLAFVGSSRTRFLRPRGLLGLDAVVVAGNSYNEIPYGTLVELNIIRRLFPGLKTVFVEAPLLMRRSRLRLTTDHEKYLFALKELEPLRRRLPGGEELSRFLAFHQANVGGFRPELKLFRARRELQLSELFKRLVLKRAPERAEPERAKLAANGEYRELQGPLLARRDWPPRIQPSSEKIWRIQGAGRDIPGDHVFELWALWARQEGLELVFYDPPVRGDLLDVKAGLGLKSHHEDLVRLSGRYGLPVVILNDSKLGYGDQWSLFSDEDHLGTCLGSLLLTTAIWDSYRDWKETGKLVHRVPLSKALEALPRVENPCPETSLEGFGS